MFAIKSVTKAINMKGTDCVNSLLLLLSAFWPKSLSGRKALWYFFHGKNSQVHYIRHVCQVRLSRKVNKIIEF